MNLAHDRLIRFALLSTALLATTPLTAKAQGATSPEALLEAWVGLWGSYDLDVVDDLFLQDDRLTYFSSETEGLIQGFEAIVAHHRGFGFEAGGVERDQSIWVEGVDVTDFGATALIGAIWFFGDPESPDDAQRGPMSLLAVRDGDHYRIGHMHFATYAAVP